MSSEDLPDVGPAWWDNHREGEYSSDPEDGYPYDLGTKGDDDE